jgi:hypothetical protein
VFLNAPIHLSSLSAFVPVLNQLSPSQPLIALFGLHGFEMSKRELLE